MTAAFLENDFSDVMTSPIQITYTNCLDDWTMSALLSVNFFLAVYMLKMYFIASFQNEVDDEDSDDESVDADTATSTTDFFQDCQVFATRYRRATGKFPTGKIDRKFITKMVQDELQELAEATDEAEEVDALLDAVYYIFDHLAKTQLDIRPIWKLIHDANMTKFGSNGYRDADGKWVKPTDFKAPDDDIREEIARQRQELKEIREQIVCECGSQDLEMTKDYYECGPNRVIDETLINCHGCDLVRVWE